MKGIGVAVHTWIEGIFELVWSPATILRLQQRNDCSVTGICVDADLHMVLLQELSKTESAV